MLRPPIIAAVPSKMAILRWFLRFAEPREVNGRTGMKRATSPPAARIGLTKPREERGQPTASSSRRTLIPSRARLARSSTILRPVESRLRMNVVMCIECVAARIRRTSSA